MMLRDCLFVLYFLSLAAHVSPVYSMWFFFFFLKFSLATFLRGDAPSILCNVQCFISVLQIPDAYIFLDIWLGTFIMSDSPFSSHPYSLLIDNGCSVRHTIGDVYYVLFVWDDVWRALLAWQSDNGNHNILNSSTERLSARLHTS